MGVLVVHGGAGSGGAPQVEGVRAALQAGLAALRAGSALDAACQAVASMEESGLFNAGRGAVRTASGAVELDAAVMTGHDANAGAIAAVTNARHPVLVARALLRQPTPVFLVGEGANAFISEERLETVTDDWFTREAIASSAGTVGAVALDDSGRYASATSTGGVRGQRSGRVGDTPVIGAGTFADERCAVSATGDGEVFIRTVFAHSIASALQSGTALADACSHALDRVARLGGTGGCVAVGPDGAVAMDHNTDAMPAGWADTAGRLHVQLHK